MVKFNEKEDNINEEFLTPREHPGKLELRVLVFVKGGKPDNSDKIPQS